MHLYLSTSTPWNANYCLPEGQVIYKVQDAGSTFGPRHFKVSRVVPPAIDPFADEIEDAAFQDTFERVGEVEYRHFGTSRVKFGEKEESINTFFKKGEKANFLKDRIFVGSDGREYKWKLNKKDCELFLNDTNTLVALYRPRKTSYATGPQPATLDIFQQGCHIADLIVVTFTYIERVRYEAERAAKRGGGM
ncbi:hypothetical protein CPB83DRAFT_854648 [Crepidotus variabilis]|uniref:DUF6593 domain-containing protein n=1 Tax=Crepidotus variabilis TaxID=179855 RepID=A0A9P6EFQ1_9AGAR|nr:hypothetical protein CPB83DRAFT_854648 [Crepidotus variabilis]